MPSGVYKRKQLSERFWEKADKRGDCWNWTASLTNKGYGQIIMGSRSNGAKRPQLAHRISWMLSFGDIPNGLCVLHRCDNPKCVRPTHLFLGTHKDNMVDCSCKGRIYKGGAKNPARGERRSKFKEKQIRFIRELYATGEYTQREIAEMVGMDTTNVTHITQRDTWAHVK